jgi:putative ABC transport system permease protein
MLYYNFKLAIRNLWRHKTFSVINILGFTIGLASCIIIGLYVLNELSFDKFNTNHALIYRVNTINREKGKDVQYDCITPGQMAPALEKDLPQITLAGRLRPWFNDMLVTYDTISLKLPDVCYADQSFLKIFSFPLVAGDKNTALTQPATAIITQSTAIKYFGNTNPLGKVVKTLNDIPVKITGVAKDLPANSSIQFTMIISWATTTAANADYFSWMNNWITQVDYTFIQVKPGTNAQLAGNAITSLFHKNLPEKTEEYTSYLQPLDNIHLQSGGVLYAEQFVTNSSKLIYTLLIIAGFILLIACFNFINLTTAGALSRAKETGIEKVLGAKRGQLIMKFFCESLSLCTASMVMAVLLVSIALPFFNTLANAQISQGVLKNPFYIGILGGLLLFISIIAGLYPAVFLSRFKSTDVFRNIIRAGKNSWLRKTLVTTQFALSILLIVSTLVVNKQMKYITNKDLGFDKDQVVVVQLTNTGVESKSRLLVQALQANPNIIAASASNRVPSHTFNGYDIVPEGSRPEDHLSANVLETDADFLTTYNIKLVQGRYFSRNMPTDTTDAIVINQAMCRYLNWTNPIGKKFEVADKHNAKVIGVIGDFNSTTLRQAVQPLAIILKDNPLYLSVKLKAGHTQASLDFVKKTWKQFAPQYPIDYSFMDDKMNAFYKSDVRLLQVLSIFAALAIIIACMGLFGLSIYTARQRTKEIGIRKVLGASVTNITALLSRNFLQLVCIAIIIACPAAWWAMNVWLQDFAYRINISWGVFITAGAVAILIALATISFQCIKAARANPVRSLRSE